MILLILHNCMFYTLFVNLVNNRILKQEQEKKMINQKTKSVIYTTITSSCYSRT